MATDSDGKDLVEDFQSPGLPEKLSAKEQPLISEIKPLLLLKTSNFSMLEKSKFGIVPLSLLFSW